MKTRIVSGLILVPFAALLYFGGYPLMAGCLFVGLVGLHEFYNGFHEMDVHPSYGIGVVSTAVLYLGFLFMKNTELFLTKEASFVCFWIFLTTVMSLLYLFAIEKRKLEDAMATLTGIFYVVFFSFHVMLVDQSDPKTSVFVWIIILSAFGTDIFAYFSGYFFGKHKLCPKISPKKTVEGSIGGIVGAVLLCGIFGAVFIKGYLIHCLILGALGGVFSQFGDLSASIFKRKMGIKDYGNLIPGHGGILDRFDSVLFTAPLVYYYLLLFVL